MKPILTLSATIILMVFFPLNARAQRTSDTHAYTRTPVVAISNNFLYESASAFTRFHSFPLAVGLERPLGRHWSIYSNFLITVPWRAWNDNAECAELLHGDLGAKWFPWAKENKPLLTGWFAYLAAGAGYYDFERDGKGYQGEEILAALGVGYGINLGRNWSLDIAVGAGPLFTQYRYYEGRSNNQHLAFRFKGNLDYFGATDAKITLKYLIGIKKKNN